MSHRRLDFLTRRVAERGIEIEHLLTVIQAALDTLGDGDGSSAGLILRTALHHHNREMAPMTPSDEPSKLSDVEYIELLWKCAYWGAELMPPTIPDTNLRRQWSDWMEQVTVERQRRGG